MASLGMYPQGDQAQSGARPRTRLPIIPAIMRLLREIWERECHNPNHIVLWAACCTCFYGFLWCGEITVPSVRLYDPECHLSVGNVLLDAQQWCWSRSRSPKLTLSGRECQCTSARPTTTSVQWGQWQLIWPSGAGRLAPSLGLQMALHSQGNSW